MTWDELIEQLQRIARDLETGPPPSTRGFSHRERIEKIIAAELAMAGDIQALASAVADGAALPPLTAEEKFWVYWRVQAVLKLCRQAKAEQADYPAQIPRPALIQLLVERAWHPEGRAHFQNSLREIADPNPPTPLPPGY